MYIGWGSALLLHLRQRLNEGVCIFFLKRFQGATVQSDWVEVAIRLNLPEEVGSQLLYTICVSLGGVVDGLVDNADAPPQVMEMDEDTITARGKQDGTLRPIMSIGVTAEANEVLSFEDDS